MSTDEELDVRIARLEEQHKYSLETLGDFKLTATEVRKGQALMTRVECSVNQILDNQAKHFDWQKGADTRIGLLERDTISKNYLSGFTVAIAGIAASVASVYYYVTKG